MANLKIRDLILKTEKGISTFEQNNYSDEICAKCVSSSVELLNNFI